MVAATSAMVMPAPTNEHPVLKESKNPKRFGPPNHETLADLTPDEFQAIARALADPRRFAILQQIAASDHLMCGKLDAQASISPATISHHLRELQEAGLIDGRRDGRQMCLKLRRATWNAYLRQLQQL